MSDDRARILEMLRAGKITVEEAEDLLDALGPAGRGAEPPGGRSAPQRYFCVRITDTATGEVKKNVRLPLGAWGFISKLTRTQIGRHLRGLGLDEIQRAARSGTTKHIIDVTDDDDAERVEVFIE